MPAVLLQTLGERVQNINGGQEKEEKEQRRANKDTANVSKRSGHKWKRNEENVGVFRIPSPTPPPRLRDVIANVRHADAGAAGPLLMIGDTNQVCAAATCRLHTLPVKHTEWAARADRCLRRRRGDGGPLPPGDLPPSHYSFCSASSRRGSTFAACSVWSNLGFGGNEGARKFE